MFLQIFTPNLSYAATPRIESKYLDVSESTKIYIKPGLVSVLEFPHSIIEVRIGNPGELKAVISQVSPRELTVYFKNSQVSATNLIVRSDRKTFVFDIIPASHNHQDYVKVSGSFGSLSLSNNLRVTESSLISPNSRTKNQAPTSTPQQSVRISL